MGHSATLHYLIKTFNEDITKFNEVILIQFSVILRDVACYNNGWVGLLYKYVLHIPVQYSTDGHLCTKLHS